MIRRPPRSTQSRSSAASDVYKRQGLEKAGVGLVQDVLALGLQERHDVGIGRATAGNAQLLLVNVCDRQGDIAQVACIVPKIVGVQPALRECVVPTEVMLGTLGHAQPLSISMLRPVSL